MCEGCGEVQGAGRAQVSGEATHQLTSRMRKRSLSNQEDGRVRCPSNGKLGVLRVMFTSSDFTPKNSEPELL